MCIIQNLKPTVHLITLKVNQNFLYNTSNIIKMLNERWNLVGQLQFQRDVQQIQLSFGFRRHLCWRKLTSWRTKTSWLFTELQMVGFPSTNNGVLILFTVLKYSACMCVEKQRSTSSTVRSFWADWWRWRPTTPCSCTQMRATFWEGPAASSTSSGQWSATSKTAWSKASS